MARKLRFEFEGAVYHVINRGNYRRSLFETDGAAAAFERCLDETAVRHEWRVHAFVIMRNHFHLAVETPKPNLSTSTQHYAKLTVTDLEEDPYEMLLARTRGLKRATVRSHCQP